MAKQSLEFLLFTFLAFTAIAHSADTLSIGEKIPLPQSNIVLTVTGKISITNSGDDLQIDIETLDQMKRTEYQVMDPWLEKTVIYSGVTLKNLLAYSGADSRATGILVSATDGYAVTIPMSEINSWEVLLATRSNGDLIPSDDKGPTRVVFPFDTHSNVAAARAMSVWSVETIGVQ